MSRSWAGGSTRQWRRTRTLIITRDTAAGWGCRTHEEGWCTRANAGPHDCARRPTEAHHIHGRAVTGDDPRYIVSACGPCNKAIGNPTTTSDPAPRPATQW